MTSIDFYQIEKEPKGYSSAQARKEESEWIVRTMNNGELEGATAVGFCLVTADSRRIQV